MRQHVRHGLWFAIALAIVAGSTGAVMLLWPAPPQPIAAQSHPAPPTAAPATPAPVPTLAPRAPDAPLDIPLRTASIAEIDARRDLTPALFRLDVDPAVLVLDFPDLHTQALMLNRVAALVEKADMPRDRVVTEIDLDTHICGLGGTPDHYYYGHDYRAADLARFFRLTAAQGYTLNRYETWLRGLLDREGWLKDGAVGALISIPGVSAEVDAASRTTIFRHELSHAVYFTDPAYVALTQHFWHDMLTDTERTAIRGFLGKDGYDTKNEDLMANEGQAYFIHTRDARYFTPDLIGIGSTREAVLRGTFIEAIPDAWLRDSALAVAPVTPTATLPIGVPPPVTAVPWSAPVRPLRPIRPGDGDRLEPPAAPR